MMAKHPDPVTVFCADALEAVIKAQDDPSARALTTGQGSLQFHKLIAEHGAGVFKTLYVPEAMRGQFKTPAGGKVTP